MAIRYQCAHQQAGEASIRYTGPNELAVVIVDVCLGYTWYGLNPNPKPSQFAINLQISRQMR